MWYLEGIRLLHSLEVISIRCCPSEPYGPRSDVMSVSLVDRTEIHQVDGRVITVHTSLRDIDGWLRWHESTMRLGDGSSVLDTIELYGKEHPEDGNLVEESLLEQHDVRNERARARLQTVRSLFFSKEGIYVGELAYILELFPALERFSCEVYYPGIRYRETFQGASLCKWLSHGKHALVEASLREHGITEETPTLRTGHEYDQMEFGADLRWLPYFRRCKKLRLPCHIRWVAELGSEMIFPDVEIPSINSLEDVTLEIMDQRAVTPLQAKRVIDFIQQNTTERTRITIRFVLCEDGRSYPVCDEDPVDWEEAWEVMKNFAQHCETRRTFLQS
jgi:hypothetical protein